MPASLFNFSRYFKKNPSTSSGQVAPTGDMDQRLVTNNYTKPTTAKTSSYSGIGNPPPVSPPPAPVNNSAINMGKRVGMDILSRLTQRANSVLMLSVNKVKELKQEFIDTEHVLWGLLHDGTIYQLISDCKVGVADIQADLEKSFKIGNFSGQPQFSPRVKRVLELSLAAARNQGYEFISPEHILLALSREGEGLAARTLAKFNLKPEVLSQKITGKKELKEEEEKKKASALEQYTEDLTAKALKGELDPVVGRSWEVERIIHILSRRTKNNPVLIGDAGVGKTAIVEGLAQRIAHNDVPESLLCKRILLLDLMSLIAGARHRGEFEERLKNLIKEVKTSSGAVILFIDEVHNMVGAGSGGEGTMDASNILKPSLARGELQVIGTTTITEYRKYIEKDPALERRFQPVLVAEPTAEVAIEMLRSIRDKYEAFHRVKISDEAIEEAVKLSQRYIADRFLPDKAVDLIDEAAAAVRLPAISLPEEIRSTTDKIKRLENEKQEAEKLNDSLQKQSLSKEIEQLKQTLTELNEQYQVKRSTTTNAVTPEVIAEIVSRWTNIPISRLTERESTKLLELEKVIHKRLINQEEAVSAVAEAVRRGRAGLKSTKRPIGSFIFLGPTGVGKTELAKALAEILFGSEEMIVRLDMTEYMEKHEVAKLIGAPPGYVGYEEGGQLTEAVRRRPYAVVLLDEIEKAHPDVFNILIQLLDDGRLTDNKGHTISFKNTIVICTSNLGSGIIQEELLKGDSKTKKEDTSEKFKTYTVSPTGRQILTLSEYYWEKTTAESQWEKKSLIDYFAGSLVTEGTPEFPLAGFDTHLIAPDGAETITSGEMVWFRTSTTSKEWLKKTMLEMTKGYLIINAFPDKPEQQLPTAKVETHAISPANLEMITLGNRFWQRANLQTKDWTTGLLADYFSGCRIETSQTSKKSEGAMFRSPQPEKGKSQAGFPIDKWDIHLFQPDGSELIIVEEKYWQRQNTTDKVWTMGRIEELLNLQENLPVSGKTSAGEESKDATFSRLAERLMEELRKFFRPELLNRYDEIIIFHPLTKDHMKEIVELQVKMLAKLLAEQGITFTISDNAKAYLAETGFDPIVGARPLRRTIQRLVENPISSLLIKNELKEGETLLVDCTGQELTFKSEKRQVEKTEEEKMPQEKENPPVTTQEKPVEKVPPVSPPATSAPTTSENPLEEYFPATTPGASSNPANDTSFKTSSQEANSPAAVTSSAV